VRSRRRLTALFAALLAAALVLGACGNDDDAAPSPTTEVDLREDPTQQPVEEEAAGGLPTPACDQAFAEVAAEAPGDLAAMEQAVDDCLSLDDWIAAGAANPAALDGEDPIVVAENVCDGGGQVAEAPLCQELAG
jgi:hypothetical protein